MEKKPGTITSYFSPKCKAAERATQPAEQETDRQGETESDGKTKPATMEKKQATSSKCKVGGETESDGKTKKEAPLTQHQQEPSASVSSPNLDKKSAEPHVTHFFTWSPEDGKRTYSCTCDKAGTIEEVLRRSPEFKKILDLQKEKKQDKELVVKKDRKAISSHFPCCLIKDNHLTVTFIKALDKDKKSKGSGSYSRKRKPPSHKLVTFHVLTKGGENIQSVMKNPMLAKNVDGVTVYAYVGEKVKHALQGDGRFMSTVFSKTCALFETSTETTVEMSDLVDHHDGKTFQIVQLSTSPPPSSQEIDEVKTEPEVSLSGENQEPAQQSTSTELENVDKLKPDGTQVPWSGWCKIPNSKNLYDKLTSIFKETVKGFSDSKIRNHFREEFVKNEEACNEVRTMKQMTKLSESVCFIQTPKSTGTGFLLFDKFVLTNGHVLEGTEVDSTGKLNNVTVDFTYESQEGRGVEVIGVVAYEWDPNAHNGPNAPGQTHDWVLLELSEGQMSKVSLLQHLSFFPESDVICIIGHPGGGVKRIDTCVFVSPEKRFRTVLSHCLDVPESEFEAMVLVTHNFLKKNVVVTYESCFYHGSSGSPVLDKKGNVVAMHSGGFPYTDKNGKASSVIEFGYPLYIVVQRLIIQLVKGQRFDVLEKCLSCLQSQKNVEGLAEGIKKENLTEFQAALCHSEVQSNNSLNRFFKYFCKRDEPMDTD